MNILMALSQLEVTGAEVYAITLTEELIKKGHKVYVVSDTLTTKTKAKYIKLEFNKRGIFQRISQIKNLVKIIKENKIDVVHAHSRASSWSCQVACKLMGIPMITTTHGRQPVHLSRKIIKAFGMKTVAVCENIKEHLVKELNVEGNKIEVLRNPVVSDDFPLSPKRENSRRVISIIGRLSGPKGEVAYNVLEILSQKDEYEIQVIGGKNIPEKFEKFKEKENVRFLGFIDNVVEEIKKSDLIVGAGRVGVETILSGRPLIAIGEAKYLGLVTEENIEEAMKSNFGDITFEQNSIDYKKLLVDVEKSELLDIQEIKKLRKYVVQEYDLNKIVNRIEKIYAKSYVERTKYEIPVIMYHRVIKDVKKEGGVHGIYVTTEQFEKHLKYLKDNGYKTLTFEDLKKRKTTIPFRKEDKEIILTFDDGYVDNYTNAFPLLKKYGYKGVIYLLSHLDYNKWDVDNKENPESRFDLMTFDMIKEMKEYGIEFGGHTKTHPRLSQIDISVAREEIEKSKVVLEEKLSTKLVSFAYPYGDLNEDVKKIVKEVGYDYAVATDSGDIAFNTDLFQIRRIGIFSTNSFLTFKRKVSGKYNFIKIKREAKEQKRRKEC